MSDFAIVEQVYAALPQLDCKRKCWDACGPIVMTLVEEDRLRGRGIPRPHPRFDLSCSALVDHRCSIYADRPLICRLYGMVKGYKHGMECGFGCVPERWLSRLESDALLERLCDITGDSEERINGRLRAIASDPTTPEVYRLTAQVYLDRAKSR